MQTEVPCSVRFPKLLGAAVIQAINKMDASLAMRSMLVRDGNGKIVLVDNGAGNKHLKQLSYYNFFDLVDLKDELQRRDVACEDVTDVILTHLHFDHCGYTTQKEEQTGGKPLFKMAFPNAIHWVSRAQWENFLHPNALEADSYFIENMQAVYDSGKLRLIENDTNLLPRHRPAAVRRTYAGANRTLYHDT